MRPTLDPNWVAIFDRPRIENCDELFASKCSKKWEQLAGTDDPSVRHCPTCGKDVFYCHSLEDASFRALFGDCVAVATGVNRFPGDLPGDWPDAAGPPLLLLGRPTVPHPPRRPWWKFW